MVTPASRLLGLTLILAYILCGLVTGLIVKDLADELSVVISLWYRFLFSLPLLFGVALYQRGVRDWLQVTNKPVMTIRVMFGFMGIVFWFLSVRTIPLGQATALFQSSVLFITMFSPLLLGERVGIYRGAAVVLGLAGIFLITEAYQEPPSWGIIFALISAIAGSGLSIALRKLGKSEVPATVASIYNGSGFIVISMVLVIVPSFWMLPSADQMFRLVILGVVASLLQICMTTAYRYSEAVVVSSMRYLQVLGAGILGYIVFDEVPSHIQLIGAAIIVGSCMFIVLREFQLSRKSS
ncbi:MAG: DMT family transporter [Candidatus Puniceispirillaceae bacterium]|jgi:drug/metabolite transporter (DMT)-like permease|nr:DMT family transporter [Pseudomonadota bacterium]